MKKSQALIKIFSFGNGQRTRCRCISPLFLKYLFFTYTNFRITYISFKFNCDIFYHSQLDILLLCNIIFMNRMNACILKFMIKQPALAQHLFNMKQSYDRSQIIPHSKTQN